MDISKIIVDNFVNLIRHLIERYIGRYIFRKTILIYQYKERLKEIVDDFTGVLSGYNRTYSLFQIIRQVTLSDSTKKIQIEDTRRMVELLEKWYSAFKDRIDKIDFFDLKYIYQTFNEFITILYETHTIFYSFFELIKEDNKIKNNLKSDISGYLKFEEIYNQTTKKFKELCKEASKDLKGEFKELNFNPLPKL